MRRTSLRRRLSGSNCAHDRLALGGKNNELIATARAGSAALMPERCHGRTSSRAMPMRSSSSFRWYCGWVSASCLPKISAPGSEAAPALPNSSQASSDRVRSRSGRITAPFGRFATARSIRAKAGDALVTPAATMGACGGSALHLAVALSKSILRRVAASTLPNSSNRERQRT